MIKHIITMSIVIGLIVISTNQSYADIPALEREALVALYNSTGGDAWTHNDFWNTNGSPCSPVAPWYGVTCDGTNSRVVGLDLSQNALVGTIPTELGNLTKLTNLDLDNNSLTGVIPSELGNLTKLVSLGLGANSLTGTIPATLGKLVELTYYLSLFDNSLTGSIPSALGNLTNLRTLYLNRNSLSGLIPSTLGNLTLLDIVSLSNNSLTGPIPASFGNLGNVMFLSLHHNQLCGAIPSALINMTTLTDGTGIDLGNNNLNISVPPALDAFLTLKTSGYQDWKTLQGTVAYCPTPFSWPMFLPAINNN
jgi:Leucine-rich repeat (LRR) protein